MDNTAHGLVAEGREHSFRNDTSIHMYEGHSPISGRNSDGKM